MIITFKTRDFATTNGDDEVIYDNCEELRVKKIENEEQFDKSKDTLEKLQYMDSWRVKFWLHKDGNVQLTSEELYSKCYQLNFTRNDIEYFVITATKVWVANDKNKTIKVIN